MVSKRISLSGLLVFSFHVKLQACTMSYSFWSRPITQVKRPHGYHVVSPNDRTLFVDAFIPFTRELGFLVTAFSQSLELCLKSIGGKVFSCIWAFEISCVLLYNGQVSRGLNLYHINQTWLDIGELRFSVSPSKTKMELKITTLKSID